jgi:hypothetical protein
VNRYWVTEVMVPQLILLDAVKGQETAFGQEEVNSAGEVSFHLNS